jgi:hypothetical protein
MEGLTPIEGYRCDFFLYAQIFWKNFLRGIRSMGFAA